jgi:hypothetical protein
MTGTDLRSSVHGFMLMELPHVVITIFFQLMAKQHSGLQQSIQLLLMLQSFMLKVRGLAKSLFRFVLVPMWLLMEYHL